MTSSPDSKADLILARFPGPVTLNPSRKKWLLLLLAGCLFTLSGIWMVSEANPEGWGVLIFFGAGTVVSVVALLPGAGGLTLDRDGFTATSLFRRNRSRWQDVSGFEPIAIPFARQKMVGFDDAKATAKTLASLNTALVGHGGALPDTYGLPVEDLARLMAQWRERAIRA